MKKFLKDLMVSVFYSLIVSLVAIPGTIIGMGVGGYVYQNKVEPWIKKKLGD